MSLGYKQHQCSIQIVCTATATAVMNLRILYTAPPYPLQNFKALYKCCIIIIILLTTFSHEAPGHVCAEGRHKGEDGMANTISTEGWWGIG